MTDRDASKPGTGNRKLWGGRFSEATDAFVERFTESVSFDQRLALHDIRGSLAHAAMLCKVGVLSEAEEAAIREGLGAIRAEVEAGTFPWDPALEDVHMNIEARLTERVGEAGKKLHTGRSRNDQVATDIRLYLRDAVDGVLGQLDTLLGVLADLAEREADTIMPGFTHLQTAQPVTFGHHMLAWFEMLHRDRGRFIDARARMDVLPLGAAALAGTTFPIDREHTRAALGFAAVSENSLDTVSDRDFALELSAASSILMVHLSRWSEELVLWSSARFGFITLPDTHTTGSSIMPQKKNPDVAELVRGKSGRVVGSLMTLITLMKGQPLAYNRDNQEDKEPLFDTLDTVADCLTAYAGMLPTLTVNAEATRRAAAEGFATATDLADYLVRAGVPFRDAHAVVGRAVAHAVEHHCDLADLDLATLQSFSDAISDDVYDVLTLEGSVNARDHIGGTAPSQVRAAVARARARIPRS